jgi:membrane-associated protein
MFIIDFILHVDQHLAEFVANYGLWIYGILFLIVFVETGLVVMPFLPGDSLLFAAGALAAIGKMDPFILGLVIFSAAALGDTSNYHIGKYLGPLFEQLGWSSHFMVIEQWFAKWGVLAVIVAGFTPIPYKVFTISAGLAGMALLPFVLASFVGRGARFFLVAGLMAWGGAAMEHRVRGVVEWLGWGVVALIGGFVAYKTLLV